MSDQTVGLILAGIGIGCGMVAAVYPVLGVGAVGVSACVLSAGLLYRGGPC